MFFIASCFGGFRGYETAWTDLAALRYDVAYSEDLVDPQMLLGLLQVDSRMNMEYGDIIIYPLLESLAQAYVYSSGLNDSSEGSKWLVDSMAGHFASLMGKHVQRHMIT